MKTLRYFENQNAKKQKTMKTSETFKKVYLALCLIIAIAAKNANAQTPLFSQNFNSSSTLSNYVSGSPNNGQFNAITVSGGPTATITANALQFVRSGAGTASFSRTTNFSPVPLGIIYKFDLTISNSSSTNTVARWQVGDGFSTNNSVQSDNDCYAQFAIDFRNSNNYRINDITNSDTYSNISGSVKTVTWVLNNSGNTLSYNAPDGTVKTVSNNRTDLWVGTTRYISGAQVEDNGNIEDIKFVYSGSSGTITMDNITITQFIPIVTTQPTSSVSTCVGNSVSISAAASGLPTPTIKWQKNISSVWTDISGETSATYTIASPVIGDAGQYRALFTNSEGATPSNTSTLTVNAGPTGGVVNSSASVCSGTNSGTLTLTGNTGTVQKWQSSTNGGSNWNDISNTSSSQNYSNLVSTTMYRAVVMNAGCTSNSTPATITVNPLPTSYNVTGGGTYCVGASGKLVGLSNSQSGVNYQLKLTGVNVGTPVSGTGSSISFGNQTGVGTYTVQATFVSTSCSSTMNGSVAIATSSIPTISLAKTADPSCYQAELTATNAGGTMGPVSASNTTSATISSSGTPTITRTITLPSGIMSAASKLTLTLNIDHSRVGNLVATLISPSCGQTVIFNRPGGTTNQDNLINSADYVFTSSSSTTFPGSSGGNVPTGTYQATFTGLTFPCNNVAGVWTLQIEDKENNGGGDLNSWSLSISDASGYTTVFNGPASIGAVSYPSITTAKVVVSPPNGMNNYTATTTDYLGCVSATSNVVSVNISPSITIIDQPVSHPVCLGQIATFTVVAGGTGLTYQWRKGNTPIVNGGRFSGALSSTLTILNTQLSDAASDYNVIISDANCSLNSSNAALTVNNLPNSPTVTPTNTTILLGGMETLTAQLSSANATFGTGNSTNNSTSFPASLGTYYGGARHQILILASELSAQGILAGEQINSLSFDVSNTNNADPMQNYTISIGNTALNTLNSSFVNGLTQVYSNVSYTAVNGVNDFVFSSPFTWNGTSNIIVETVFNNNYLGTTAHPNCSVKYTTTSGFTSVNYSRADNAGAGNAPILALSSNGTSNRRPNMVIGHSMPVSFDWSPVTGLFTDAGLSNPYTGGNYSVLYAQPRTTTSYAISTISSQGCASSAAATALVNVITTPPNCVSPSVNGAACITAASLSWTAATNYPSGYYIYVAKDNPMTDFIVYMQDVGNSLSYSLPLLEPNTTYYYIVAPYNSIGENTSCVAGSFVSGVDQAVTPNQSAGSYTLGAEGVTVPNLPCGVTIENYDGLGTSSWYTSATAPHSGTKHMRIDKNSDNATSLDDWFFSPAINVISGKVYRLSWYDRIASGSTAENYNVYFSYLGDGSTMEGSAPSYLGTVNSTTYTKRTATDYLATSTGQIYFGFRATSPGGASQGSIFIDDIQIVEIPVPALIPSSCTTLPSMYNQIYVQPVFGATNYRYKIVGTGGQSGYSFEHYRNNSNIDYRMKWAPGVVYGNTYNVSVAYYKNGSWSPYGASCPVSLGAFPQIKLRDNAAATAGPCDYTITDLNNQFFTDSISGANDYEYKIVENDGGNNFDYDHTWRRGSANLDFRLVWAYQSSPLIERVRFGYSYDVTTRALVGKTGINYGNRPGEWGPFGVTCKLDLTQAMPSTSLTNCNITLSSLNEQIFTTPVAGATNYEYEFTAPGYTAVVYRTNGNTDYRLTWIPTSPMTPGGVKYATTYSVRVKPYVGGVWLNYGTPCTVTTPAAPTTSILDICGTTLGVGRFNSFLNCTPVPGASMYAYRITNVGGVAYQKVFYNYNSNTTFSLASTLACCGQQNMLPNSQYTIEVAFYAGEWSAFGPACTFTTGATIPRYSPFSTEGESTASASLNLNVYPNPVALDKQLTIELQGIESQGEQVEFSIVNLVGAKVFTSVENTQEGTFFAIRPDVKLTAGVYLAEAKTNGSVYRVKFVVQ